MIAGIIAFIFMMVTKEPLNTSLRTQRGLKAAAVVFCGDGQGGSLS